MSLLLWLKRPFPLTVVRLNGFHANSRNSSIKVWYPSWCTGRSFSFHVSEMCYDHECDLRCWDFDSATNHDLKYRIIRNVFKKLASLIKDNNLKMMLFEDRFVSKIPFRLQIIRWIFTFHFSFLRCKILIWVWFLIFGLLLKV